jgi:hypothetical protein
VPKLRLLVAGFPPRRPGFEPRSGHVGFVVDKVALGQVFSEYFGFVCQFSFHRLLHTYHHLSSEAGTVGETVADMPSGPQETGWLPNCWNSPSSATHSSIIRLRTSCSSGYVVSNCDVRNKSRCGRKRYWPISWYYPGMCPEEPRKTMKNFTQGLRCHDRNSNWELSVYKSETLQPDTTSIVTNINDVALIYVIFSVRLLLPLS